MAKLSIYDPKAQNLWFDDPYSPAIRRYGIRLRLPTKRLTRKNSIMYAVKYAYQLFQKQ